MTPLPLRELAALCGGTVTPGDADPLVRTVTLDSRSVPPDALFWAVRGDRLDGHDFLHHAAANGAVAVVSDRAGLAVVHPARVHRRPQAGGGSSPDPTAPRLAARAACTLAGCTTVPTVHVADTLDALWALAAAVRHRSSATVVGVAGSHGKTSTREMVFAALRSLPGGGTRSAANRNNRFGVPLSLLEIAPLHRFAVVEIGASHVGEIAPLAALAAPRVAVLTGIGRAHLGTFGSAAAVRAEKAKLFAALPADGLAVVNGDDPVARSVAAGCGRRAISVGTGPGCDVRAADFAHENGRLAFAVSGRRFRVPAAGRQFLPAALAALAVGRELGLEDETIAAGLATFEPVAGRCRPERVGAWTVIDDTYNAAPEAFAAAIRTLAEWRTGGDADGTADTDTDTVGGGRRWLVCGTMADLGPASGDLHEELGRRAAEAGLDRVLAIGEHAGRVTQGLRYGGTDAPRPVRSPRPNRTVGTAVESCADAVAALGAGLRPGDVVLVKGSRVARTERVIDGLRRLAHIRTAQRPGCSAASGTLTDRGAK